MLDVKAYELINKCSLFVLFDFIRSVGGKTTVQERLPDTQQQIERNGDIKQAAIAPLKV